MNSLPRYVINSAVDSDPLKAGAIAKRQEHWSQAPLRFDILNLHTGLEESLKNANSAEDLKPYFDNWYQEHADEIDESMRGLQTLLDTEWAKLVGIITHLTDDKSWGTTPITLSVSSIAPSSYWSQTSQIDIFYLANNFKRDLLHELFHLRTEQLLGDGWFIDNGVVGSYRPIFIELIAEIVFKRDPSSQVQAARSPYPFFADYSDQIGYLSTIRPFDNLAKAVSEAVISK